jgi:hypothetical protein
VLESGLLLLFIAPGLAAYSALYGLFHSGKSIAPEPPAANAVETIAVIASAALLSHFLTAAAFGLNMAWCISELPCPLHVPVSWFDPYRSVFTAMAGKGMGTSGTAMALGGVLIQSGIVYGSCRVWLNRRAKKDNLPAWIYGWATELANSLDNSNTAVIAYVLTTMDLDGKTVAYGGLLNDIKLDSNGSVTRVTLVSCERYLVDLKTTLDDASLSPPLSQFTFMSVEGSHIRNLTFETIEFNNDEG